MNKTSINNISYLNTWINTIENDFKTYNDKNTIWENVVISHYSEINDTLYDYLNEKLKELKKSLGQNFKLALLCSIRNLARIIKQIDELEVKFKNAYKKSDNIEKMRYLLDTYTTLAQGPFFDELDILNSLISILEKKDYTSKSLGPAITFLSSKKNNFSKFSLLADVDIRNSQDHNNVSFNNYNFIFKYQIGSQNKIKTIDYSSFKNNLEKLIQGVKTFVKVIVKIISAEKLSNDDVIKYVIPEKRNDWFRLLLTTSKISCEQFEIYPIMDGAKIQIAISFTGLDVNEDNRLWFMINSAIMAYTFITNEYLNFDRIFVNFKSPRTIPSFIALPAEAINKYIRQQISFNALLDYVDGGLWPVNDDIEPLQDISYHDIKLNDYSIKDIEDISSEDRKIFKAVIIAPNITTASQVYLIAKEAIALLKKQPNGGTPTFKTKHGSVLADRIYFVVYKSESQSKGLFESNSNFIATIQFDIDKIFPINNTNPLLNTLQAEILGDVEYKWNPNFLN